MLALDGDKPKQSQKMERSKKKQKNKCNTGILSEFKQLL